MTRRPDLFIIGAAKCGTTSLYSYLKGHPEIYMSPRKEPRYFSPDLMRATAGKKLRYGEDLDRYLALFAEARDEKRLGEATARYIYSQAAARLIHDFEPNSYIVALTSSAPQWLAWRLLPRLVGDRAARQIVGPFRKLNRRTAPRPKMSPELRRRLEEEFAPDVARTSELLGRDLAALWFGRAAGTSKAKGEAVLAR